MSEDKLILTPLKKALDALEDALNQEKNEFTRDASIQRFKYSFELSWKMLKRYLKVEAGIEEHNIKNLFRQGAKEGLIENAEPWFDYHKTRNLTTHTYNETTAEETYEAAKAFSTTRPQATEIVSSVLSRRAESIRACDSRGAFAYSP